MKWYSVIDLNGPNSYKAVKALLRIWHQMHYSFCLGYLVVHEHLADKRGRLPRDNATQNMPISINLKWYGALNCGLLLVGLVRRS